MHNAKRIIIILAVLLFTLSLTSACRSEDTPSPTPAPDTAAPATATTAPPTDTATPTSTLTNTPTSTPVPPTATPTPIAFGPNNFPTNINPLTGLLTTSVENLERRPVSIKINLVPRTTYRPTWGLSLADMVWEYYHNDGYTRLHAIFYSQDSELAGAIRSGRMPDHDLVQMYKSIFAYGSADRLVNFRLMNSVYAERLVLESQTSNCPPTSQNPLCRIKPQGPNLLLSGTNELHQYIENRGVDDSRQNLDGMTFHSDKPAGMPADEVIIHYSMDSYGEWQFNPENGKYALSLDTILASNREEEDFAPLVDQVTNEPIEADNIVLLVARHQYYQPPPNEIVEILLNGTGKAYAFRDGKLNEVVWNRPAVDSVLYLTYEDGGTYAYKPGTTWYHVIGETSVVEQVSDDAWRFDFRFP